MKKFLLIILVSSAWLTAAAQFEKIIQPSDLRQQTIVNEPVTLRKGYVRAGVEVVYFAQDKYFNENGEREYFSYSQWGSHYRFDFSIKYGLSDRFEIDLYVPLLNEKAENYYVVKSPVLNTDESFSSKSRGRGLGDLSLMLKYQVIPEKENNISLTLFSETGFPSGAKNQTEFKLATGQGCYRTAIWLFARKIHHPYSVSALAYYYYNFWGSKVMFPTDTEETRFKKGNRLMLGGRFDIQLNDWIAFGNEIYYFHSEKGKEKGGYNVTTDPWWEIQYVPRLVFQVRRFRISQSVQLPLFGKSTGADPMYSMSVQYTF